jgi:hypothetical protein
LALDRQGLKSGSFADHHFATGICFHLPLPNTALGVFVRKFVLLFGLQARKNYLGLGGFIRIGELERMTLGHYWNWEESCGYYRKSGNKSKKLHGGAENQYFDSRNFRRVCKSIELPTFYPARSAKSANISAPKSCRVGRKPCPQPKY